MQSLKVRILNEEYAFRAENPDLTRAAVEEVNRLIGEYRQKLSDYSPVRLAVLAATSLAEKVFEHEQHLNAIQEELERLNRYVMSTIEENRSESQKQDEQIRLAESEADLASAMQRAKHDASALDQSESA